MDEPQFSDTKSLCDLYGLETTFHDGLGSLREPGLDVITPVLISLGAELEAPNHIRDALVSRRRELMSRFVEPVKVLWGNANLITLDLQSPTPHQKNLDLVLTLETGEEKSWQESWDHLPMIEESAYDGTSYQRRRLSLPDQVPLGYHHIQLSMGEKRGEVFLIVAPEVAFQPEEDRPKWGAFLPLYSVRSRHNWGAGDYSDLASMVRWVGEQGGHFVGTLPLFSSFLDSPFDPSPYAPISRLFWNELYIDCRTLVEGLEKEIKRDQKIGILREQELVDYLGLMRLKAGVLRSFLEVGPDARAMLAKFLHQNPEVEDYARFRAVTAHRGMPWSQWPSRMQKGILDSDDYTQADRDYFLFAQCLAHQQIQAVCEASDQSQVGLYLDLPLGVHPDGYDAWRYSKLFAPGVSGGAPPDAFFTAGQDWGFRPMHPRNLRLSAYHYLRKALQKVMAVSDLIRIDHAMSLQRLYWIPLGMPADKGVYVRYPMEELLAVTILESHRNRCVVVGEDLGTVSDKLRTELDYHGIFRMYVGQFEIGDWPPVNAVPRSVVASLNTHDTPTVASFWEGQDIELRQEMGLLQPANALSEHSSRERVREAFTRFFAGDSDPEAPETLPTVVAKWLDFLARSPAHFVQINLPDLWLEKEPHNVPGTGPERPNWRRKARLSLEEIGQDSGILEMIQSVCRSRQQGLDL